MCTGMLPFRGDTSGVIFKAILDGAPTSAVRLNPDLPVELERIINRALDKDRDLRYQHASDMRAELQRLKRQTEPTNIVATEASPDKTLKRHKLWVVLATCIAVIGAGGAWYLRSWNCQLYRRNLLWAVTMLRKPSTRFRRLRLTSWGLRLACIPFMCVARRIWRRMTATRPQANSRRLSPIASSR